LIAHVSAIFLLPVLQKSVIINDFRAIAHSISAREGGNTVCCNAMVRNRTGDNSVTYWFPWKHPMARRRGLEFGVFDQTPPKNWLVGSALRASPCASFAAFAQKHNPNVGLALWASPVVRRKCTTHHAPLFCPFDVRLVVSGMLRSTPTTLSVIEIT